MPSYVGQLMSSPVHTVTRTDSVRDAAQTCLEQNVNSLVVVDEDGGFYGIVTTTDLLSLIADDTSSEDHLVEDYATTGVVTVSTDTSVRETANVLMKNDIHHVPVLTPDKSVKGIASTMDVVEFLSNTRD